MGGPSGGCAIKILPSLLLLLFAPALGLADPSHWAEGSSAQNNDGANRQYYNQAAVLPWEHFMGDWRDAKNAAQGEEAYAVTEVVDDDSVKRVEWDVMALVEEWLSGKYPNQGLFLRAIGGRGPIMFASREHEDANLRPKLVLSGPGGSVGLDPAADTYLTKSTFRSQGLAKELRVSRAPEHLLIRFELPLPGDRGPFTAAKLILHSTKQYGSTSIGVFRCRQTHSEPSSEPVLGIAARYPADRGIADDAGVIFATSFESEDWAGEWTQAEPKDRIDVISPDTTFEAFQPLQGKALRSRIAKGSLLALNTLYKFRDKTGSEPEEVYFRYYLRLADDWKQTIQGGKLPGISGTYGRAGWGGRKVDGTDGWSARGLFLRTIPDGNPLAGKTPVGFYCYHADMEGTYGTNWVWQRDYRGYLANNRWYAIEQFCRMNAPDENDGILRAWVDGRLAFEKTDIRFRRIDTLKIEQIWMNIYHGGTRPSPHDQHAFIDNVVVAKQYIGPMGLDR